MFLAILGTFKIVQRNIEPQNPSAKEVRDMDQ